jgi:hypothetical protein
MNMLPVVTVVVLLLATLLVAVFKGSRPPQPIPSNPTAPKRAKFAALVPVVCAVVSYATFKAFGSYLRVHLVPPEQLVIPMRVGWFVGVIAPWFVGLYFAYVAARAANKALRAIGALEVLICLLYGSFLLFASTVGFG